MLGDTRPPSNSVSCSYVHHENVLSCAAQAADLPYSWDRFGLTSRERDVAGLLLQGAPNKEIAWRLSLGVQNVKNHVQSILGKTRTDNRTRCAFALAGYIGTQS